MAHTLVVVESAAKSRTIQHYLGAGCAVRACFGHVRDLPTERLGSGARGAMILVRACLP
jgi:DNA topoisomerase I